MKTCRTGIQIMTCVCVVFPVFLAGASAMPETGEIMKPESLPLTVDDAVLTALEQNRSLRVVRFEPAMRRELEIVERSIFHPVLSLDVEERRIKGEISDRVGDEERISVLGQTSMLLPLGTRWGVEAGADRSLRGDDDRFGTRFGLDIRQPLLRGAGRSVNVARLEQARLDTRMSEYELRAVAESLVEQVESFYWEYALAKKRIDMVEESLRLAERQLEEIRQRIRIGAVPATEEAAARAEVALRREAQIDAVGGEAILRVRLLRLIAPDRPCWDGLALKMGDELKFLEENVDPLKSHLSAARARRPDLNQARLLVKRGEVELIRTANGILPRMDIFLRLGKTGYADSFGSAFSDLDGDSYDASAGLGFEWPAGNRAARARHRYAELDRDQLSESLRNVEDLVREDVHIAHVEVGRAREQVQAKSATRDLQEETLRVETAKFAAGKSTSLMVAHAQRELLSARVAEAEAVVRHRQALSRLYRLDGTLLIRRGIDAPGFDRRDE